MARLTTKNREDLATKDFALARVLLILFFLLVAVACSVSMSNCWYGNESVVCCSNGRCVDAKS